MATAKWSAPGTASGNLNAGGQADSLATGSTSAFLATYANGTNLDLYASVSISLASIAPTAGGSITLRVFSGQGATVPDNTASVGGGDAYTLALTTSTGAKVLVFPMVRLYPANCYFTVTNNAGVTLGTGNTVVVQPYDEASN